MTETNPQNQKGKATDKLHDVICIGVGANYRRTNPAGEAESENAETDEKTTEKDLQEKLNERIRFREIKRQLNIDSVSQIAFEQLVQEETVSPEPVNEDWISRFFNIVEDISDKSMQGLWGRILAAEVMIPGTFSLRTLEILKNLSQKEAAVFIKFAGLALHSGNTSFVINPDNSEFLAREYNISFDDRMLLEEAGLLASNDLFYTLRGQRVTTPFEFGRIVLLVERGDRCPEQSIPVLAFTKTGSELRKLIRQPVDQKYFNRFAQLFYIENVRISYAYILSKKGPNITHSNPTPILPSL